MSGRGDLSLMVSALGLILAVTGGVVSARAEADAVHDQRVSVAATEDSSTPRLPFVVEPTVGFETVSPPGSSRTTSPKRPTAHPARGVPQRLMVPELGVNAPVVRINAPNRVLLPPGDPQVLGWWQAGSRPGARFGSALITGHTVSYGGGAFDDLDTLEAGDRVFVRTSDGLIRYRVSGVTIYRKASLAKDAAKVFSQSVPGRLVLITCEDWNGTTYLSNAVVLAEPLR